VASSSRTFFQQIGGSIGVSAFGAIFAHRLTSQLSATLPGVHLSTGGGQSLNPVELTHLPAAIKLDVFAAITHAIQGVFLWAAPSALIVFVLAWLIKEVPLRGRAAPEEKAAAELVS
jgi:hypothetical protein